ATVSAAAPCHAAFRRPRDPQMDPRPHPIGPRRYGRGCGTGRRVSRFPRGQPRHRLVAAGRWRLDRLVMRRREWMLMLGSGLAVPRALRAQQKAMRGIGWLSPPAPTDSPALVTCFPEGLPGT